MQTLLGKKSNMTSRYNNMGFLVPVTTIVAEPNVVLMQKGGKVVIGTYAKKKVKKTENAYVKAAGFSPRFVKEVKATEEVKAGDKISVSIFSSGDEVKITGITKGRGFAGVVKRHGFSGGPKTHGQSDRHRAPGSIGAGTTPGRVYKGKKMAGHMGATKITVTGLEVVEVNEETNTLLVKGAVPGARNGFLVIEKTGKVKGYTPPPPPNEEKQAEKEAEAEAEAKEARTEAKTETAENIEVKPLDKQSFSANKIQGKAENTEKSEEVKEAKDGE